MNTCNNSFWNSLPSLPVWTVTPTHFVCTDQKTGVTLDQIERPKNAQGNLIKPFEPFNVWLKKNLIVDADDIAPHLYQLSKSTSTRSKRVLPAGTMLEISLSPAGNIFPTPGHHFHIRIDLSGQFDVEKLSGSFFDFFSFQPITPSIQAKRIKP